MPGFTARRAAAASGEMHRSTLAIRCTSPGCLPDRRTPSATEARAMPRLLAEA